MNDMYAKDISKKIASVKRDKQRRGLFIGGKPVYGYKMHPSEKNRIVIDEEAASVVRRIFAMALSGQSCRQIAIRLNAEGVPPPSVYAGLPVARPGPYTGLWSSESIARTLLNETYIGNMVQGRSRKISYKSKKCVRLAPADWIVVENTHEALIDQETFYRVQAMVDSRRHTRSRTYDFLLKGIVFCHECGRPLAVVNRKNAAEEDVLYFVCRTYQRFTKSGMCTSHTIQERTVTQAVLAKVREVCQSRLQESELLSIAEMEISKARARSTREKERAALNARVEALVANLDRMYMDKLNGLLAEADFERLYQRIKRERSELERRMKALKGQEGMQCSPEALAREFVRRFQDGLSSDRELLVTLVERVELTQDKQIIIKFRFRDPARTGV